MREGIANGSVMLRAKQCEVQPRAVTSAVPLGRARHVPYPVPRGVRLKRACARVRSEKAVTWLILPVVICLSQRLSHACLSMNAPHCETANGSLNQL